MQAFFCRAGAKYDNTLIRRFYLWRNHSLSKDLNSHYKKMGEMIFGDVPTFEEILSGLGDLDATINEQIMSDRTKHDFTK